MLKERLSEVYKNIHLVNGLTYKEIHELSGLTISQLSLIIKNNGKGVSLDKMEEGLYNLGVTIDINFNNEGSSCH